MISWLDNFLPSCCSRKRKEEICNPIIKLDDSVLSDNSESDFSEEIKESENIEEGINPTQDVFESRVTSHHSVHSVKDDSVMYVSFQLEDSKIPKPNLFETKKSLVLIAPSPPDSVKVEVVYENEHIKRSTSPEPFTNLRRIETDPIDLLNSSIGSKNQAVLNATTRSYKCSQDFYADSTSSTGLSDSRRNSETWRLSIQTARQILGK